MCRPSCTHDLIVARTVCTRPAQSQTSQHPSSMGEGLMMFYPIYGTIGNWWLLREGSCLCSGTWALRSCLWSSRWSHTHTHAHAVALNGLRIQRERENMSLRRKIVSGGRGSMEGEGIEGRFDPNTVTKVFRNVPERSFNYTVTFQMMFLYV